MKKKLLLLGLILVLIISLTGCLGQNKQGEDIPDEQQEQTETLPPNNEQEKEEPKEDAAEETVDFTVYFSDNEAMYLKGEKRTVAKNNKPEAELMIEELIKGPESDELMPTIPEGTKLLSLEIENKIAIANFSKEIQTNHPGGSTGESMTVYSIVQTLTQLPEIEAVQFLVEGEKDEAIWGHLFTLDPIEPNPEMFE